LKFKPHYGSREDSFPYIDQHLHGGCSVPATLSLPLAGRVAVGVFKHLVQFGKDQWWQLDYQMKFTQIINNLSLNDE